MYNRYIPQQTSYAPIPPQSAPPRERPSGEGQPGRGLSGLLSGLLRGKNGSGQGAGVSQTLRELMKNLGLKDMDTGDILLALIVLFLILEDGDDLDLVITLALMILLNLGEP